MRMSVGAQESGRICNVWFVRVGLPPPNVPVRTLADWCRDFNLDLKHTISYASVGHVRDAFCEIMKRGNREALVSNVRMALAVADTV